MEMDVDDEDEDWNGCADVHVVGSSVSHSSSSRIILHFDLDCFYAQVEMIRNPALRNKPLGIQQKYIIVTCNYVARDLGVTKLSSVTDALEKCPQLVLVKGEDLTHYREMSYKVTELLMSYCPLVERLGFDENFVDVTDMVDTRIRQTNSLTDLTFSGHVYNKESSEVCASEHPRLAVASQLAAELREALKSSLALTSCAGIATNKLLAKLVSGTFKPNQQTTLLPESTPDIMARLSGVRRVPGIGHSTGHRLKALGLATVRDLQCFPSAELAREFGAATALRLQNLAQGIDNSPVTPAGPPQSLSDEDSFKKMSSTTEVLQKVEELLTSLTERMQKDGRQPSTFRLTIRRFSATNRYFSRESRQCPIPNHIAQKITAGSSDVLAQLVNMGMKLFHKMVDTNSPFHLTLINVCFSNLHAKSDSRAAITSFFTQKSPKKVLQGSQQQETPKTVDEPPPHMIRHTSTASLPKGFTPFGKDTSHKIPTQKAEETKPTLLNLFKPTQLPAKQPLAPPRCPQESVTPNGPNEPPSPSQEDDTVLSQLPPDVDPEVFRHLPESIQQELLSSFRTQHGYNHSSINGSQSATGVTGATSLQSGEHGCNRSAISTSPSSATGVTGSVFQDGEHRYNHTTSRHSATLGSSSHGQTAQTNTKSGPLLLLQQASILTTSVGSGQGDERVTEASGRGGGGSGGAGRGFFSTRRQLQSVNTNGSRTAESEHHSDMESKVYSQLTSGHPSNVDLTVRESSFGGGGGLFFSPLRETPMRRSNLPTESSNSSGDDVKHPNMEPTACSHQPSDHPSNAEPVKETIGVGGGGGGGLFFSTSRETCTNTCHQQTESHSSNKSDSRMAGEPSGVEPSVSLSSPLPSSGPPLNVDPTVFSELPPELQRELLAEWRQQKPALKMPSTKKPAKAQALDRTPSTTTKDRKPPKAGQANSLLKYFKPS
ncbi:DNA polymerase iota [Engraulis encrasicolus]|uniref:DNA polymerase iota n=1 Tax=Engraulis encrasicolus TaxID=184585 RepID=UPI002FD1A077